MSTIGETVTIPLSVAKKFFDTVPFGGGVRTQVKGADSFVAALDELKLVLKYHGTDLNDKTEKLRQMEQDVEAVRRVFGLDQLYIPPTAAMG